MFTDDVITNLSTFKYVRQYLVFVYADILDIINFDLYALG